jgi:hypothetical protein
MAAERGTTAKYFDAIVALVAGGMQIKAACNSRPEFPNWIALKKFLQNHPNYRTRLDAVRPQLVGEALARDRFEAILALIESGKGINAACAAAHAKLDSASLYRYLDIDPNAQQRFNDAIESRESGDKALGVGLRDKPYRRWTEKDFEEAVAALRDTKETSVEAVLSPPLMPKQIVYRWAKGNQRRTEMLRTALDARPIAAHRRAVAKGPKPVYQTAVLRSGLLLNELYREASDVVSKARAFDSDMREDMISEVILAVTDGTIERENIKTDGLAIALAYKRRNGSDYNSIDRALWNEDGDGTFLDTLSTSEWSFEGAI